MRHLTKYSPNFTRPFWAGEEMDKLFNSFLGGEMKPFSDSWTPATDIFEDDEKFTLKAELPGVDEKDIKITLEDNVLTVKGERKEEKEVKGKETHRTERVYGSFTRSFKMPREVQADKIDAVHKNGILEISLPKSEKIKPKEIAINVVH